jgi:hypothetical protein
MRSVHSKTTHPAESSGHRGTAVVRKTSAARSAKVRSDLCRQRFLLYQHGLSGTVGPDLDHFEVTGVFVGSMDGEKV